MLSGEKYCSKCGKWLPLINFHKDYRLVNNYVAECKECKKKKMRQYKGRYGEKHRKDPQRKFSQYRSAAKIRKLEFKLSFREFRKYWQKPCYYCGFKIDTIGLDRRDNLKGYTKKNVVPCCEICNRMKLACSEKFFIEQCKKIARQRF